jgi:undecaprenyl-diphosphatase
MAGQRAGGVVKSAGISGTSKFAGSIDMELFHSFVLGVVQGLGEFLPISSSAHLIIVPWLFGWRDPGLNFDIALHWGTLAAVLAYFRSDVGLLIRGFWRSLFPSSRDFQNDLPQRMSWLLVLASVPGAIFGKLLDEKAESLLRSPLLIAATLGGFGIVLLVADRYGRREKGLDRIRWLDALLIGFSQALAIVPGISRSGATIAAGLGLGFQRESAARFSFLMSIPIIFGAGIIKLKHFHEGMSYADLAVGFLASAIFGFFSIKYFLRFIARHDFRPFVWYRLALAALILMVFFSRHN